MSAHSKVCGSNVTRARFFCLTIYESAYSQPSAIVLLLNTSHSIHQEVVFTLYSESTSVNHIGWRSTKVQHRQIRYAFQMAP
jgi:hypothetical protein